MEDAQQSAISQGYTIIGGRSKGPKGAKKKQWLKCDRGSSYKHKRVEGQRKRDNHKLWSQNCPFECVITYTPDGYQIRIINKHHNHDPLPEVAMPSARRRAITPAIWEEVKQQLTAGSQPKEIINYL